LTDDRTHLRNELVRTTDDSRRVVRSGDLSMPHRFEHANKKDYGVALNM